MVVASPSGEPAPGVAFALDAVTSLGRDEIFVANIEPGKAIDIDGGAFNATFSAVTSTSSPSEAIEINNSTGEGFALNNIGTAYLRIDLLPADAQPKLRDTFRRYVDSRINVYRKLPDIEAARAELANGAGLQNEIWTQAVGVVGWALGIWLSGTAIRWTATDSGT